MILVANLGWGNTKELERLRPHLISGNAFILKNVPLFELRKLYSNAIACIAASYVEGFSYSGIESMKCGTPVIASDIDTHRDVYRDAALYFDPFVPNELAKKLNEISEMPDSERGDLIKLGDKVADIYSEKNTSNRWTELMTDLY